MDIPIQPEQPEQPEPSVEPAEHQKNEDHKKKKKKEKKEKEMRELRKQIEVMQKLMQQMQEQMQEQMQMQKQMQKQMQEQMQEKLQMQEQMKVMQKQMQQEISPTTLSRSSTSSSVQQQPHETQEVSNPKEKDSLTKALKGFPTLLNEIKIGKESVTMDDIANRLLCARQGNLQGVGGLKQETFLKIVSIVAPDKLNELKFVGPVKTQLKDKAPKLIQYLLSMSQDESRNMPITRSASVDSAASAASFDLEA